MEIPASTLACPQSLYLIRKYMPDVGDNGIIIIKPITEPKLNNNLFEGRNRVFSQCKSQLLGLDGSVRPFS